MIFVAADESVIELFKHFLAAVDSKRDELNPAVARVNGNFIFWLDQQLQHGTLLFTCPPAPQSTVPNGWKLVPIEPTDEMISATKGYGRNHCSVTYRLMLAAAPTYKENKE